jgi:hypothetical protein
MTFDHELSYRVAAEFGGHIELVIENPAAMLRSERELTFHVTREQARELAAQLADIERAFVERDTQQAGMSLAERVILKRQQLQQAKQQVTA